MLRRQQQQQQQQQLQQQQQRGRSYKSNALFASYLANMNMPNVNNLTPIPPGTGTGTGIGTRTGPGARAGVALAKPRPYNLKEGSLPDNMRVDVLVKKIGVECSWQNEQMKSDIMVLNENRIYTVKDLRVLSKESWRKIELLPIVKDLLREVIGRGLDDDSANKRIEKKGVPREILGSSEIKKNMNNSDNIIKETQHKPIISEKRSDEKLPLHPVGSSVRSSVRSSVEQPKLFMPPPNKIVIDDYRMKVKTSDGRVYEVDRLCPHAKADLSIRGVVIGSKLFCTKHCLSYDLKDGGKCTSKHENHTINACPIDDW